MWPTRLGKNGPLQPTGWADCRRTAPADCDNREGPIRKTDENPLPAISRPAIARSDRADRPYSLEDGPDGPSVSSEDWAIESENPATCEAYKTGPNGWSPNEPGTDEVRPTRPEEASIRRHHWGPIRY